MLDLEPRVEPRIPGNPVQPGENRGIQEWILGHIHLVPDTQQNVINVAAGAVAEGEADCPIRQRLCRTD